MTICEPSCAIIALAITVARGPQMSTTLLYRSPDVTRPDAYCCWISLTCASELAMMPCFFFRHQHVVGGEREASASRQTES